MSNDWPILMWNKNFIKTVVTVVYFNVSPYPSLCLKFESCFLTKVDLLSNRNLMITCLSEIILSIFTSKIQLSSSDTSSLQMYSQMVLHKNRNFGFIFQKCCQKTTVVCSSSRLISTIFIIVLNCQRKILFC